MESFVDAQPQRKVPLPIEENLDLNSTLLQSLVLAKMSPAETDYFNTETNFLEKITSISGILKPSQSKDEKKAIIREKLIQYNQEIPKNVYLPTNQKCHVVGIVTTSGMPMQSAARVPILVSFEVQDYEGPDQDPQLQRGGKKPNAPKSQAIEPQKQKQMLVDLQANVSKLLQSMNAISFDKSVAEQKI